MKTKVLLIYLCALFTTSAQETIKAKIIDQWPATGSVVEVDKIYDRVTSHVYIFNDEDWLELFKGKNYTGAERKKIGIKKGEEPDFLSVSIRVKHPSLKGERDATGKDIGISIPLFTYDFREDVAAAQFKSFQNTMFLKDVKVKDISQDIIGQIEIEALSSNDSKAFWTKVASITGSFANSALSLAMGDASALGDIKDKLSEHLQNGVQAINSMTNEPIKRNYSTWIKLLSRSNNEEFDEYVSGIRLYEVNWTSIKKQEFNKLNEIEFPVKNNNLVTVEGIRLMVENANLGVPLILVIEVRTKTRIDKRKASLSVDYKDWASREYEDYTMQKQFTIIQEYFETYKFAFSASESIENFVKNNGNEDANLYLFEAINFSYLYYINSVKNIEHNNDKLGDPDLKPIVQVIEGRFNSIRDLLNSKFSQSSNYALRDAGKIVTALYTPLSDSASNPKIQQFLERMNQFEAIVTLTGSKEAELSDGYIDAKTKRNKWETILYNRILDKTPDSNRNLSFYQGIETNYKFCNICYNIAVNKIGELNEVSLVKAKEDFLTLSNDYFEKFNASRDSLSSQFPLINNWLDSLDEVSQAKYKPYYDKLVGAMPIWILYVKKDRSEVDNQSDIKLINEWTSNLKSAMSDIIVGGLFFSEKSIIEIPQSISSWFENS